MLTFNQTAEPLDTQAHEREDIQVSEAYLEVQHGFAHPKRIQVSEAYLEVDSGVPEVREDGVRGRRGHLLRKPRRLPEPARGGPRHRARRAVQDHHAQVRIASGRTLGRSPAVRRR